MNNELIEKCNERLLSVLADYLNNYSAAITKDKIDELCLSCKISEEEAFSVMLSVYCGLGDSEVDKTIRNVYLPQVATRLEVDEYFADLYYRNIKIPTASEKNWAFGYKKYAPYEGFVFDDMEKLADGKIIPKIGYFSREFKYPCVFENGREWMLICPNEINTMRGAINKARGKVLSFGLGLGYFQYMAHLKGEVTKITVVERDKSVIELFNKYILNQFEHKEKIEIVCADAFWFAENEMAKGDFDFVFCDIWHDVADGFELYNKFKKYEKLVKNAEFSYWIEKTLLCYE